MVGTKKKEEENLFFLQYQTFFIYLVNLNFSFYQLNKGIFSKDLVDLRLRNIPPRLFIN
ncbi:MAG: hypothetical protein GX435_04345 [Exilispira sp.]|nr:hypothetical protein [Exilispira sp.]